MRARLAVIGKPVAHSWSPRLHRAAYAALGIEAEYDAVEVEPGQAHRALDRMCVERWTGVNVTVPLKEECVGWCAALDASASAIGAVNTVRFRDRMGLNTDAPGLIRALAEHGMQSPGKALILGAGGTARAAIYALKEAGWEVTVWNRTAIKAEALASEFGVQVMHGARPHAKAFSLLFNATAASLAGAAIEVDFEGAAPGLLMDAMYGAVPSPTMERAAQAGWRAVDGRTMLLWQAALAFSVWFEVDPPIEAMRGALP